MRDTCAEPITRYTPIMHYPARLARPGVSLCPCHALRATDSEPARALPAVDGITRILCNTLNLFQAVPGGNSNSPLPLFQSCGTVLACRATESAGTPPALSDPPA